MAKTTRKLTPAMRQYMDAKRDAPEDAILLFRMGDFYELFFEDAKTAAPVMDVVLTARAGVPMCGVPYHAMKTYVSRLLSGGFKVAIAEQIEDPKMAKGLVKRAITQIITPGTVMDDGVLDAGRSNFLVAVNPGTRDRFGVALIDVSTADFRVTELAGLQELETEIQRLHPAECLIPESLQEKWHQHGMPDTPPGVTWTPVDDWMYDLELARSGLCRHFEVASLDGFGCRGLDLGIGAAGAVMSYTQNSLRQDASHITGMSVYRNDAYMVLDRISQRNLELTEPIFADARNATLLSVLDCTTTPMGGRLMREWILRPLCSVKSINRRLDAVQAFVRDPLLLSELREALSAVRDLERTIVRVNIGSANARDMKSLQLGLAAVPGLKALVGDHQDGLLADLADNLADLPALTGLLERAIADDPPITIKEGGMIRAGYDDSLDMLHRAAREGKSWIAAMQAKEQERTGIKSLKIRFNKVFGYFIEVTKTNLDQVPEDYIRKQTLTNAERYITPELKELEDKVTGSEEKSKALEYDLFQGIREEVIRATDRIQGTARAIAAIDVITALAHVAMQRGYVRPTLTHDRVLEIIDGRHPVLEALMTDEPFVPNNTRLDTANNQVAIITGPNMAGKSTYIRQVALLVLMAQMGGFVPAKSAVVGVADRIFTRVGAADDLSRGQSTFMVEMVETANILNNATDRSLIILDEIGRGTSTFDGLSLAWAVAEYLHDHAAVKARTLFATHYHELTELSLTRPGVQNYNVAVREQGEKVIFLRKILPGSTDKSYGIHVARLAGLPGDVICRANEVLENLEGNAINEAGDPTLARHRPGKRRRTPEKPPAPDQPLLFEV